MTLRERFARWLTPRAEAAPPVAGSLVPRDALRPKAPKRDIPAAYAREVVFQTWLTVETVQALQGILGLQRLGQFQLPSLLAEKIQESPRARGVIDTRLNGLTAGSIRWEPARNNEICRRAAAAVTEDWPLIAPPPHRRQRKAWGLFLGAAPTQKHWYQSGTGRWIPRIEPYHPYHLSFQPGSRAYYLQTIDGLQVIPSPAWQVPGQQPAPPIGLPADYAHPLQWMVHEPWGPNSHRQSLIYPTADLVFEQDRARVARGRWVDKHGLGIMKLLVPEWAYDEPAPDGAQADDGQPQRTVDKLITALRNAGRELVVPLVRRRTDYESFELSYLEGNGLGFDGILQTIGTVAVDLAILWGGHNLVNEVKGGGSFAALDGGLKIRADVLTFDAVSEAADDYTQLIGDYTEVNFGSREVAPIRVTEVDPPAINHMAALTVSYLANALGVLAEKAPWIDLEKLVDRFRIPILPPEKRAALRETGSTPPASPEARAAIERVLAHVAAATAQGASEAAIEAAIAGAVESLARPPSTSQRDLEAQVAAAAQAQEAIHG